MLRRSLAILLLSLVTTFATQADEVLPFQPLYTPTYGQDRPMRIPLVEHVIFNANRDLQFLIHRDALEQRKDDMRLFQKLLQDKVFVEQMEISDEQLEELRAPIEIVGPVEPFTGPSERQYFLVLREWERRIRPKLKRYQQFLLQRYWSSGVESALYHANIELTPAQRKTIQHPSRRRDGDLWGRDEIRARKANTEVGGVEAVARERERRLLAMLTEEQWDRIEELFGEPFDPAAFGYASLEGRRLYHGMKNKRFYKGRPRHKTENGEDVESDQESGDQNE